MEETFVYAKNLHDNHKDNVHLELQLLPEELEAIGHVSAQWAFFEHHANNLMSAICEIYLQKQVPKGFESDSFRKRRRNWKSITKEVFGGNDKDGNALIDILDLAGSLQGQRQKIIHSLMRFDRNSPEHIEAHSHKNPNGRPLKINAIKIQSIAHEIAKLNAKLIAWPLLADFVTLISDPEIFAPALSRAELLRRLRGKSALSHPIIPSHADNNDDLPK